jgi:hypothetical protein
MVAATPSERPDALDRRHVAELLHQLRDAVQQHRFLLIDETLHGLCNHEGINDAGIQWATDRIADALHDPAFPFPKPTANPTTDPTADRTTP